MPLPSDPPIRGLFRNDEIEALQRQISKKLGYELIEHRLELYAVPLKKKPKKNRSGFYFCDNKCFQEWRKNNKDLVTVGRPRLELEDMSEFRHVVLLEEPRLTGKNLAKRFKLKLLKTFLLINFVDNFFTKFSKTILVNPKIKKAFSPYLFKKLLSKM